MRRRAAVVALMVVATVTAACGSSSGGPLASTADKLADVHSGVLDLRLSASAGAERTTEQAGFRLQGPFAQGAKGHLPTADITYTQLEGPREQSVKVVSTGDHAYVVRNGQAYVLSDAQASQLKVSGGNGVELHLDKWFNKPVVSDGGTVDGVAVQKITGPVNVASALDDLFQLSKKFGAADVQTPRIKGDLAKKLASSTQSATAEVVTGKQDHFLRHLVLDVTLRSQAPPAIRQALGRVAAVQFHFDFDLSRPNQPVHVAPPSHPLPASQLPSS